MLIGHTLGWHWILAADILLLHVLLVGHLLLLFGGNVMGLRHAPATGHVRLWRRYLWVVDFFGRLYVRLAIDTVLAALRGLRCVETGLQQETVRQRSRRGVPGARTWIRFLPSALVTNG